MRFDSPLILFFIALTTLALLHQLALMYSLYWVYAWFDVPMHFLGGVIIGLGTQTALFRRVMPIRVETIWMCLVVVFAVGIAWEIFEWWFVLADAVNYKLDTLSDLVFDLMGGTVGYMIATLYKKQY